MADTLLLALYGSIVIADGFLVTTMATLAWREGHSRGWATAISDNYFWLAMNMAAQSLFIGVICGYRAVAIILWGDVPGRNAWVLVAAFAGLLVTKLGFNWSASSSARSRLWQLALLVLSLGWWAFVLVHPI